MIKWFSELEPTCLLICFLLTFCIPFCSQSRVNMDKALLNVNESKRSNVPTFLNPLNSGTELYQKLHILTELISQRDVAW